MKNIIVSFSENKSFIYRLALVVFVVGLFIYPAKSESVSNLTYVIIYIFAYFLFLFCAYLIKRVS